jgi:hypothetical protein
MRGRRYALLQYFRADCPGADYYNYKANIDECPIFCILADKHQMKFYKVSFDVQPFKVERAGPSVFLTGTEGSAEFLISLKRGTLFNSDVLPLACGYLFSFLVVHAYVARVRSYMRSSVAGSIEWVS